ncbi:MAG: sigma-70 family RNA polymerase sigma factor [Clostridia bacterium]|nr:sigma-70 family RNA polymerase sigma factor [Clostridia bacterium]
MSAHCNMEISTLILMARSNDDLAFAEIVRRYTPMLHGVISRFNSPMISSEEAFSEATFALYRATLTYDIGSATVTFGLYARTCVRNHLYDIMGKAARDGVVDLRDVETLGRSDGIESVIVSRERLRRALRAARQILSDYEYSVLRLYLRGYTTAEMARELSKSPKSIDNAKARMLKRLRENSDTFSDF